MKKRLPERGDIVFVMSDHAGNMQDYRRKQAPSMFKLGIMCKPMVHMVDDSFCNLLTTVVNDIRVAMCSSVCLDATPYDYTALGALNAAIKMARDQQKQLQKSIDCMAALRKFARAADSHGQVESAKIRRNA